jgi:hypothetical protein
MGVEENRNRDRAKRISEAKENFEAFIREQKKIRPGSAGEERRSLKVENEYEAYGSLSIYEGCHEPYTEGVTILVKTLNGLNEKGIHTKLQLLELDSKEFARHTYGFSDRNAIIMDLLKDFYRAELDL